MTALRHDVAHLGHAELFTPEPERSLWFFVNILGLTETGRAGDSVYLRTWDDYEQFSLKLTARAAAGRASAPPTHSAARTGTRCGCTGKASGTSPRPSWPRR